VLTVLGGDITAAGRLAEDTGDVDKVVGAGGGGGEGEEDVGDTGVYSGELTMSRVTTGPVYRAVLVSVFTLKPGHRRP